MVASLLCSPNNPIITVCHTGMGDPHATCSAGGPDPLGWQPGMGVRVLPQWDPVNGFKNIHLLLSAKPKPEPEIGCEIALFEGLGFENGLKEFHSSLSPSFFSLFFFRNRFMSRQATCVLFQPSQD